MIQFEKITNDSLALVKKRLISSAIIIAIGAGLLAGGTFLQQYTASLAEQSAELHKTQSMISASRSAIEEYKSSLQDLSITTSKIVGKEDLVIALGDCAKAAGCSITALSSKSSSEETMITRYSFDFEVKGSLNQIAQVLKQMDSKDIRYSINEISLRQEADYLWLQRDFEDQISWWDLSNVSTVGGSQESRKITAEDILTDEIMKFYLSLDFIVVKETPEE